MTREAQHVVLVVLGATLVRVAAGEQLLRYVRPGQRGPLLAAAAVVVALAVAGFVADLRGHHGHGDHGHDAPRSAWLLLAPVLTVALVAPPALGADAVARAGVGNALRSADLLPALPPGGPIALSVGEFVQRAVGDGGGSLGGREVSLTGFAVRRGAAVDLARLTIVCCAADARATRVRLVGDTGDPASDTWLRVRGTLQPGSGTAATHYVPALTVRSVEVVAAPADPYEY